MKFKYSGLVALAVLASACSTNKYVAYTDHEVAQETVRRSVANSQEVSDVTARMNQLTKGIYHSYLYGQSLLEKFDQELEKNPEHALDSTVYSELMTIRSFVDNFETEINDLYVSLVMTSSMPEYTPEQKAKAEQAIEKYNDFLKGILADGKELPENLRPMVLTGLASKQTEVADLFKSVGQQMNLKSLSPAKKSLQDKIARLSSSTYSYSKDLSQYEVDSEELRGALEDASKDKDFVQFKKDVSIFGKEMKSLIKEVKTGRSTSSAIVYPSTGSAGNITGNGFPSNTWALTYDDGPAARTTGQVIANHNKYGYKGTFFVLERQARANPSVMKSLVDNRMDIANHTNTHPQVPKLSAQVRHREVVETKNNLEKQTGRSIKLFRLPYGAGVSNAAVRKTIADAGMIHVFWNVDTLDWQDKNPQSVLRRTIAQMSGKKGGIILFHDIHATSVTASDLVMDYLKKQNKIVCTVQGIVDQQNKNLPSCN